MDDSCCTCAALLSTTTPPYDEKPEKSLALDRRLDCCGRVICGNCQVVGFLLFGLVTPYINPPIQKNHRFETYCPFCQMSTNPSPLPQGLREPPTYTLSSYPHNLSPSYADELPPYSSLTAPQTPPPEKSSTTPPAEDVLHFLDHEQDSLTSLSLRYGVPIPVLRRSNNITSDHLLLARRTVIIPGKYYKGGVSLSPRPIEGEEEERRKAIVRRWMVACKVSDYDIALLYLEQAHYQLEVAVAAYKDDEQWEKEHPMQANVKGKGKTTQDIGKRRFTGQRS